MPPRRTRRRVLALGGTAAAMALAVTAAPIVSGAATDERPASGAPRFLVADEGGFSHNDAHLAATRGARLRAAAIAESCDLPSWRAENPEACPTPGTAAEDIRRLRLAAAGATVQASSEPDGVWGPLMDIPSTAIHAVVMHTGQVLLFSQPKEPVEDEATEGGNAHVWDPVANTSTVVTPPVVDYDGIGAPRPANLWCAGQVTLSDGRVLVVGGNLEYPLNGGIGDGNGFKGARWVMTFDPVGRTWTRHADMPRGRWYPTLTELPDGRVLIIGGWDETGGDAVGAVTPTMVNNQDVEVFDPATNTTTVVSQLPPNAIGQTDPFPDHEDIGLYPHTFVLPDKNGALGEGGDKVLVAGPGAYDSAVIDTDTWLWTDVFDRPYVDDGDGVLEPGETGSWLSSERSWGTAYLEPSGPDGADRVVMLSGVVAGNTTPGTGAPTDPLETAEVLDLDANDLATPDPPGWEIDPDLALNEGRGHFNSNLLPDGSILVNGGGVGRRYDSLYSDPIYAAELYTPGEGWRTVAGEADARTYHSVSVLLPDGRVASAGDDRDIAAATPGGTVADHIALPNRTAQLYSPPYLFDGPRPLVTFAPAEVGYDASFRMAVAGDPAAITGATLIRPGAVTHSVDMQQRAIRLPVSAQADGVTLTSPRNATVAPPGHYMLFLLNADGVPSVASWVRVHAGAAAAPALPIAPATPPAATTPAPAIPTGPALPATPLRATLARPAVRVVGARVRVGLALRANRAGTARVTLRRPGGRPIVARTVTLRAGVTARPAFVLRRSRLGALRSLRVRVVIRDASGGRLTLTRVASLPARAR